MAHIGDYALPDSGSIQGGLCDFVKSLCFLAPVDISYSLNS